MQKKLILPVAVLSVAMLTACSTNSDVGQGLDNTTNRTGMNTPGYNQVNNDTRFNRVTYDNNRIISPFNQNTTMNRTTTNNNTNRFNNATTNNVNRTRTNNGLTLGQLQDAANPNTNLNQANDLANNIARMVDSVTGVDSAKTLVVGDTIFIGLDIDHKVSRNNVRKIEQEVHRVVSTTYPDYEVRVTSDRGLFQRTGTFFNNDMNGYNQWENTTRNRNR